MSNWKKNLANVNQDIKLKRIAAYKKAGHVLLKEAEENGQFTKLAWDTYKKVTEPDLGTIWSIAELDGEKWLIVQTDDDGRIVRSLIEKAEAAEKMSKTASVKEAIKTIPGDIVTIASPVQSINRKYTGIEGEVVAAYPERSKLSFQDGYSLWVENKDLKLVRNANTIGLGDTIEIKGKNLKGQVTGIEKENIIIFKSASGATFKTRLGEFDKILKNGDTTFIQTDDPKSIFKFLYPQQTTKPAELTGLPEIGPEEMPPSIKANPTEQEMKEGTSIPAKGLTPQAMAAEEIRMEVYGRVMNVGDRIMNKATGQEGTIEDIRVDRKLGKFYMVNYGGEPVQEYETNLMKVSPKQEYMERPMTPIGEPYHKPVLHHSSIEKEAQGGPSLETLRGGGTSGPANVRPLTWEVHNEDKGGEGKEALINEALEEEMDEGAMGAGKITIEIDPVTKKFTVDFGEQEGVPEENIPEETEAINPQKAVPPSPGSPIQVSPGGGKGPEQSEQTGGAPNSQVNF
jgi:hypothetical protein